MSKPPSSVLVEGGPAREAGAYDFQKIENIIRALDFLRAEAKTTGVVEVVAMIESAFTLVSTTYYCILRYRAATCRQPTNAQDPLGPSGREPMVSAERSVLTLTSSSILFNIAPHSSFIPSVRTGVRHGNVGIHDRAEPGRNCADAGRRCSDASDAQRGGAKRWRVSHRCPRRCRAAGVDIQVSDAGAGRHLKSPESTGAHASLGEFAA